MSPGKSLAQKSLPAPSRPPPTSKNKTPTSITTPNSWRAIS